MKQRRRSVHTEGVLPFVACAVRACICWYGMSDIAGGTVHDVPADLKQAIGANALARVAWHDITALARNEWICWVESAKTHATRQRRIRIAQENLARGERRPCCWPGCPHR